MDQIASNLEHRFLSPYEHNYKAARLDDWAPKEEPYDEPIYMPAESTPKMETPLLERL